MAACTVVPSLTRRYSASAVQRHDRDHAGGLRLVLGKAGVQRGLLACASIILSRIVPYPDSTATMASTYRRSRLPSPSWVGLTSVRTRPPNDG